MKKALIIIDMQNDFVTGALANVDAQKIVSPIAKFASDYDGDIILTRDTHGDSYLMTQEGEKLPIRHCVRGTPGHDVVKEIRDACSAKKSRYIDKCTFGFHDKTIWDLGEYDEVDVVGTCTDICVVSNVLILKSLYPSLTIRVHDNLCAGLTPEKHAAAIEVMKSCQAEVV